ncbi:hypothetical protein [Micromonospora sp. NPDC047730]|uniref:hypothetical protein n=1 Tax=Micromonospora sp. NPDC047730 TaxID=3364253 RepID=UPI00371211B4
MREFWAKILASALLTLLIKGGVALAGHWIAWWFAALISLVVVFGGWFIITGDWDEVFR